MSRNIVIAVGGIILVAVAGAYYFSLQNTVSPSQPVDTVNELNESQVPDTSEPFSVEIPNGWKVVREGSAGVRLFQIMAESPDWKSRSEVADGPFGGGTFYETGAAIQFHVSTEQIGPPYHGGSDDEKSGVVSTKEIIVGGDKAVYHVFKEPSTEQGLLLDAHVKHGGNQYLFRFMYNPDTYPQGEELFNQMLKSVKFTR